MIKNFLITHFPTLVSYTKQAQGIPLRFKSPKTVFNEIYQANAWGDPASLSGPASNLQQTETIRRELPKLIKDLDIQSMLDVPCGDFYWMKEVKLGVKTYLGGDIVEALVIRNNDNFAAQNRRFIVLDILSDQIPTVDLIFCRDCFIHFSFKHIWLAIQNLKASRSHYLVTTTFTRNRKNTNIATGQWRPINLQLPPFSFPDPFRLINETCTLAQGAYSDKSLGVWKLSELPTPSPARHDKNPLPGC